jgi:hypothetical protein
VFILHFTNFNLHLK